MSIESVLADYATNCTHLLQPDRICLDCAAIVVRLALDEQRRHMAADAEQAVNAEQARYDSLEMVCRLASVNVRREFGPRALSSSEKRLQKIADSLDEAVHENARSPHRVSE